MSCPEERGLTPSFISPQHKHKGEENYPKGGKRKDKKIDLADATNKYIAEKKIYKQNIHDKVRKKERKERREHKKKKRKGKKREQLGPLRTYKLYTKAEGGKYTIALPLEVRKT